MTIMQSIKPIHCENIAIGRKGYEVRKTKPRIPTPFKSCIYCCKPKKILRYVWTKEDYEGYPFAEKMDNNATVFCKIPDGSSPFCSSHYAGKVIGEYICDEIKEWVFNESTNSYDISDDDLALTCLTQEQLWDYGKGKTLYGWHISDLKIYDKPRELCEFEIIDKEFLKECPYRIRVYNNPDYTNGALLKGSYICNNSFEPNFCRGECGDATKPLIRPPQSYCYVEEVEQE